MLPAYEAAGEVYPTIQAAARALGTVTYDPSHKLERRPGEKPKMELYEQRAKEIVKPGPYRRSSLLKEVKGFFPKPAPSCAALYTKRRGDEVIPTPELAKVGVAAIKDHLAQTWDPNARHVVMFSSGYDSRIMGACLAQLARENGDDWLGDSKFCCFWPEVDFARRSYLATKLASHMFHPIGPNKAVDYYAECLDFATMGARISDIERFWGGPLKTELHLAGYLDTPKPLQVGSAIFGDEMTKWNRYNWGQVAWFLGCFFFDNPGVLPGRPDAEVILPFSSEFWTRMQTTYRMPDLEAYPEHIINALTSQNAIDALKLSILWEIDPKLAPVPNWRFEARKAREKNRSTGNHGPGHFDQQKISAQTAHAMESAYSASWFAKTVGPTTLDFQNGRTFVYWSDRNTTYMKAAILQNLIDSGVTVSV
jgi:hypothetical protein